MKLQQLVEAQDGGLPLFANTIKKLKIAGAAKYLKKIGQPDFEAGVRAAKAGVSKGYWNYAAQAGMSAKINGDVSNLSWAVSSMKRVGPQDDFVENFGKSLIPILSQMEEANGYFKGIDAFNMAAQAVADFANGSTGDSLDRSLARAMMKRIGIAEYYGVKDAA